MTGGGGGVELAEEVDAALLQASGLHGSTRAAPAEVSRGQAELKCAGGVKLRRRTILPEMASGLNSGEAGTGLRGKELGELPRATAKLLRGLARAKGQRSSEGTVAGHPAPSRGKAAAARVWVAAAGWR